MITNFTGAFQKTIHACLIIFFLTACRGREVTIPLAFEGEKLVLWGKLEAGKPARIQVMRTFPATGTIPELTAVNTAAVTLFKNREFYARLTPMEEDGFYGSDLLIEAGQSYAVHVEAEGFPTAESAEVTVPAIVPGFGYTRKKDAEPETNSVTRPHQDLISIHFKENLHNSYLTLGFLAYFEDRNLPSTWPSVDNIIANEEDCHAWGSSYDRSYGYLFMMNGDCIPLNTSLNFFVNTGDLVRLPDGSSGYKRAYKISMLLAFSSKEWFIYNQTEGKQPEGLDHLVLPPQKAYTNVKNGYGIIYGYNSIQTDLM